MRTKKDQLTPDYIEHRKRLKERFIVNGLNASKDYEILELILTFSIAQKDVKPLAKELIKKFKNFRGVVDAPIKEIEKVNGIGQHSAILIKLIKEASNHYLKEKTLETDVISSPAALLKYLKSTMSSLKDEHFRVLFLNSKNEIIKDETVQKGTVDETPVYPRKILTKALEVNAVSLIFAHNHPSGYPSPSHHDRKLTNTLIEAAQTFSIKIHDHIIIGKNGYFSFKEEGLI
jgi:DNA repair protein RadC